MASRTRVLAVLLAGGVYLALEAAAYAGLRILRTARGVDYQPIVTNALHPEQREVLQNLIAGRTDYLTFSATLGWTIKPHGAFRSIYRANGQGLRGDREYDLTPAAGRLRIATFGDSYTHGDEVGNGDTWQRALEDRDSRLEVLNFGVSGYGLDQALLRYREEGVKYGAPIVLIGFMSENIRRSVSVFRPFYTRGNREPWTKPRFALRDTGLVLLENPLRSLAQYQELLNHPERVLPVLGEHDYYFQTRPSAGTFDVLPSVRLIKIAHQQWLENSMPILRDGLYDEASEAFQVTTRTLDSFVAEVRRNGGRPVVVVFPNQGDLRRLRRGSEPVYQPLLRYLDRRQHPYIDAMDALVTGGEDREIGELIPGHYSPLGNRLMADQLLTYFVTQQLLESPPPRTGRPR